MIQPIYIGFASLKAFAVPKKQIRSCSDSPFR